MTRMKFLTILTVMLLINCKNEKNMTDKPTAITTSEFTLPEWAKKSVIYEVNIRQYTPEGTINAFSDHIPRLKEMGVEILWVMPVFPISTTKKKGELGSYYAVTDYTEINPAFGTKEDFINLIDKIHAYDMKIILDWVPNHTGWDHKWLKSNPDFFKQDSAGNIIDPIDDNGNSMGWEDVAALNYNNPEMRTAMINDLIYWVKNHQLDGYRMDIAFGPPHDFWRQFADTITAVKPDIFLLAEAEDPWHLNENTFHACYGWSFHHLMNAIAKGEKHASEIQYWRDSTMSHIVKGSYMHFTSNHDENSWNGTEFERMGDGHRTFAVLVQTFDGIPLIYSGQEEPLKKRLAFFQKDDIGFKTYEYAEFYAKMNTFKKDNPALWNLPYGGPVVKIGEAEDIFAFKREKGDNKVVVMCNFTNQPRFVTMTEDVSGLTDIFSLKEVNYKKGEKVRIEPWEYVVASNK